jgi:hypothetical protein
MLFKPRNTPPTPSAQASSQDDRWMLTDLEAAQRRNLYAAGPGDRPRSAPRWQGLFGKRR